MVQSSFAKRAVFYACDDQLHHQFRLVDRESGRVLDDSIEIHTVELAKYNGAPSDVRSARVLEQWAYWVKNSSQSTEELESIVANLQKRLRDRTS